MYAGLRASGKKPDLALVVCDTDAVSAGTFHSVLLGSGGYMSDYQFFFNQTHLANGRSRKSILLNLTLEYLFAHLFRNFYQECGGCSACSLLQTIIGRVNHGKVQPSISQFQDHFCFLFIFHMDSIL